MRITILPYAIILTKASEVFLIFTTQLYQFFFLFGPFNDEPKVFLPKYSQTGLLHAAHFRVSNVNIRLIDRH